MLIHSGFLKWDAGYVRFNYVNYQARWIFSKNLYIVLGYLMSTLVINKENYLLVQTPLFRLIHFININKLI